MRMKNNKKHMNLAKKEKGKHQYNPNTSNLNIAICPACETEVPLKQGFRVSALTCPKCGNRLGKK